MRYHFTAKCQEDVEKLELILRPHISYYIEITHTTGQRQVGVDINFGKPMSLLRLRSFMRQVPYSQVMVCTAIMAE